MTGYATPVFFGTFAPLLSAFVEYKRMAGYKYNREIKMLQNFNRFLDGLCLEDPSIPEQSLYDWLSKRDSESDKTFSTRNSIYRQLYKFSLSTEDFVLPVPPNAREKLQSSSFVPYIFSHEQIRDLFEAIDTEVYTNESFTRCAPLLFRLLYGTGLRINEALSLVCSDISPDRKIIMIRDGKNDNSRLVPLSEGLSNRMKIYLAQCGYAEEEPVFQSRTGTPVRHNTVYDWYRRVLWKAGIPHQGRGKGPRLHDLRHTFAVHSLMNAVEQGMDINAFLPILCTYLGHQRLAATEKYLRLTADAYPSIMDELNRIMDPVIPEVADYEG